MSSYTSRALTRHPQPDQTGFTLVEIMVGLVIGMLATLVVMQVFSVFENQKRTTTGAADALTNGNIALFKIARDAEVAGYALVALKDLTPASPYDCATITIAESGVTEAFPVSVVNDVDGSTSDSITLRYGTTEFGGIPAKIQSLGPTSIQSSLGCAVGDITLVVNGTACTISHVTAVTDSAGSATLGTITLAEEKNVAVDASLTCLKNWREVTYKVLPGNILGFQDTLATDPVTFQPLVAGVANIQVQYGISATSASPSVIAWVDPIGVYAAPAVATRKLIKAIRIAVVARDAKLDVNNVTTDCNQVTNTGLCAWADTPGSPAPLIDLAPGNANWKQYRYRVFETTIPLRNAIWNAS